MIRQKINKKKLYMNIAVLVLVFSLIGYLILSNFVSVSSEDENNNIIMIDETPEVVVVDIKYKDLKKVDTGIFQDERYLFLRDLANSSYFEVEKGNLRPFEKE